MRHSEYTKRKSVRHGCPIASRGEPIAVTQTQPYVYRCNFCNFGVYWYCGIAMDVCFCQDMTLSVASPTGPRGRWPAQQVYAEVRGYAG